MKRLTILIVLISLIAIVSNAEDFNLLADATSLPSSNQNFSDFSTWFLAGALCTGAGLLVGLVASEQGDPLPGVIIGTGLGLGTALTISLSSSSGLSVNEQVGFRLVPVVLGAALSIIIVPAALAVGTIYFLMYICGVVR
jgi:hypothetical protein